MVMMMSVIMTTTCTIFIMMVMMFVVVMVMAATCAVFIMVMVMIIVHIKFDVFHGVYNNLSINFFPWSCDDCCMAIFFFNLSNTFFQFVFFHLLSTANNDCSCIFNLIIEKFTEIFHIHIAFLTVYNSY